MFIYGLHHGNTCLIYSAWLCRLPALYTNGLKQNYQNAEMVLSDQNGEILQTLRYLSNVIESIKKPMGTRDNPARFCKDLLDCQLKLPDGRSDVPLLWPLIDIHSFIPHVQYSICRVDLDFVFTCWTLWLFILGLCRTVLDRSQSWVCIWCLWSLLQLHCGGPNMHLPSCNRQGMVLNSENFISFIDETNSIGL